MPRTRFAAAVLVAFLSGCAVTATPVSAQTPGWTRPDLKPVTQPAVVGNRVVLYAAAGETLRVVALDVATGTTAWSYDATASDMAPGQAPYLAVAGTNVIYLAKRSGALAAVTAVDAETGVERWHSDDGFFGTLLMCRDTLPAAVCVSGMLQTSAADFAALQFDAATGKLIGSLEAGDSVRDVSEGLVDPGNRDPELLVATRGDRASWTRPLVAIFGVGRSTDFGWNISRFDRLGLFVGSVGSAPRRRGKRDVFDLSREMTAGFRISNGRTKWRRPGFFQCSILPCPGAIESGYESGATAEPRVGLRLVEGGRWSFPADPNSNGSISRDARATLQGFAPASGRTLWSFDAERNVGLIRGTLIPPRVAATAIVLRDGRGRLRELDLERGTRRPARPDTVGWCRRPIEYTQHLGFEVNGVEITSYSGQQSLFPCAAGTGRRVTEPAQVPAFLGDIGARSADLIIWSDTSGVRAAPAAATRA